MASWLCDAIFSQRNRDLKKPPKLPQQRKKDLQLPLYPNLSHIPVGGGLKCCEALLLSAHCSWTLFSSGKTTPSFHTWDVKEISHVDCPQGCGFRQIYLKQCKGLNASHVLRLVSLGRLGLDLESWFSSFSSRAERHSWWSQNEAYSWKRFKQMFFVWHLYGPSWLLQLGWHRKSWAVSLMVEWVGLNENTPIFDLSSRVCPQICEHWCDNTGGKTDQALKLLFMLCMYFYFKLGGTHFILALAPTFSFPLEKWWILLIRGKHFGFLRPAYIW